MTSLSSFISIRAEELLRQPNAIILCSTQKQNTNLNRHNVTEPSVQKHGLKHGAQIQDIEVDGVDAQGKPIVKGQVVGFLGPSGVGKCLAKGTPVLKYNGSVVSVESIRVGDLLMGPDSRPRRVLSLAHGVDEMYDIVPIKGDSYQVNRPHILSLKLTGGKRPIVNLSVEDYLKQSKTFKGRAKTYRVGVDFPAEATPIDPYFLGLWLGDGDSNLQSITTDDAEIVEHLHAYAGAIGGEVSIYEQPGKTTRYNVHNNWNRECSLKTALKTLGVLNNKHVPLLYRANSREVRLRVGGFDRLRWAPY